MVRGHTVTPSTEVVQTSIATTGGQRRADHHWRRRGLAELALKGIVELHTHTHTRARARTLTYICTNTYVRNHNTHTHTCALVHRSHQHFCSLNSDPNCCFDRAASTLSGVGQFPIIWLFNPLIFLCSWICPKGRVEDEPLLSPPHRRGRRASNRFDLWSGSPWHRLRSTKFTPWVSNAVIQRSNARR